MLKDLFYIGLGGAILAKEKIEEELKELSQKGKISKDDARELIEKAKIKALESEKEAKEELKKILKEIIDELGLATKEDIRALKEDLS